MTVTGATSVLGIIGDPIRQARTPALMNEELARRGRDAVLVALGVRPEGLEAAVRGLRVVGTFLGAVVTMPHKQAIVSHLDELTDDARQLGAVNVIRREPDGRLRGDMLDGRGLVAALAAIGVRATGRSVLLVGAGGAATAIAFAVAAEGPARLSVLNRTARRAEELVARLGAAGMPAAVAHEASRHDVVINASSAGMRPEDPLPVDAAIFDAGTVYSDIVIAPPVTRARAAAQARGALTQNGEAMLQAQIALMADFILGP